MLAEQLGGSDGAGSCGPGPPTSPWDDVGVAGIMCHLGGDGGGGGAGDAGGAGGAGVVEVDAVSSFHLSPHLTNVSKATPLAYSNFSMRPSAACC
jgi:hypothetical protein